MKPLYKRDPVIKDGILHPGNGKVYQKEPRSFMSGVALYLADSKGDVTLVDLIFNAVFNASLLRKNRYRVTWRTGRFLT